MNWSAAAARRMNPWNVYVLGKLLLQVLGYMRVDPLPELAAFALMFGLTRPELARAWARAALGAGGTLLAGALFWHASFLPAPEDTLPFVLDPALRPDKAYFMSFLKGVLKPWQAAAGLGLLWAAFHLPKRRTVDLTVPAFALLAVFAVLQPRPDARRLDAERDAFYAAEAARRVDIPEPAVDFDIVFVHVCSLSWDDLWSTGMQRDPFFERFDALLTRFNSVSSYSEQSAIRLLRAVCGQARFDTLFTEGAPECSLLAELERAGYAVLDAQNHNGQFQDWTGKITRWGRAKPPLDVSDLQAVKLNFNGSAINGDYDVLERLWKGRLATGARRAALYYNTVSLHTGARPVGDRRSWRKDRTERFRLSTRQLFEELTRFFALLEGSGRNVVVVFVPEHGGAVRGSQLLVPGMRDLPMPAITLVPVGVKLIGPGRPARRGGPVLVTGPTSYLALAHILARFAAAPPFGKAPAPPEGALSGVPETRLVAEGKKMVALSDAADLYLNWMDKKWVTLPRKFHPGRVRTRP
ncbi:MAG: cellulose biosynthesis protein BcsG [Elusimicrobia bacterium]|nr:cellulose biosynthesis protein BcsG [Elusimicrobiota bacterium]